ncbi:MAG TPA: hypothetical protein VFJ90_12975 [Candidatus Didemnitutus sp.]|nr:hypothetical protein [Candidatus Didemnitutus sp.]
MSSTWPLPPCPHLPPTPVTMDASALTAHGASRDAAFFLSALTYGQHLWQRGLAARAILSVDRAFQADVRGDEPELIAWPMPYSAIAWLLRHTPPEIFIGNPRVHYQHLADRMNEPRREQRRWRAWACWALARQVRQEFPADPKHQVVEPEFALIQQRLEAHGIPGEAVLWRTVMDQTRS